MLSRDELLEQVLALGPDDRAVVAGAVQESLHHQSFSNSEIAAAWAAEIDRRADAVERGEMPTEDWRTVIARLQNRASNSRPN
jgi:hypothetical protein